MTGYFVTGTDTDVGKSVACAYLMHALGADYWKPVQAGLEGETDSAFVARISGLPADRFHKPRYELRSPLSPHEAARRDGIAISLDAFDLPKSARPLIVEGAGGALVPLNGDALMVNLMRKLRLPIIVVARTRLGTINHTLLTLEALRTRRLDVAGVILSGPPNADNRRAIEIYGNARIVMELPFFEPLAAPAIGAFASANPLRLQALA
jgi:dethiobiotin synthetase